MDDYFSIDDILNASDDILVTTRCPLRSVGVLDRTSSAADLETNSTVFIPLWLGESMHLFNFCTCKSSSIFTSDTERLLKIEPTRFNPNTELKYSTNFYVTLDRICCVLSKNYRNLKITLMSLLRGSLQARFQELSADSKPATTTASLCAWEHQLYNVCRALRSRRPCLKRMKNRSLFMKAFD